MRRRTPLGAVGRGLVAGVLGTAVMTGYQGLVAKLRSSGDDVDEPEAPPTWEDAPAPAQVARRVIEGVFHRHVPAERIPFLTNATHWAYGIGWGGLYGLIQESVRARPLPHGVVFGLEVWGASYAAMVPMGLYEAPWEYPPKEVAVDVSYHVVYGVGVAAAHRLIAGR